MMRHKAEQPQVSITMKERSNIIAMSHVDKIWGHLPGML